MATKSNLKRGFKAEAERLALKYKEELKILPHEALCAFKLAKHLSIPVYPATKFLTELKDVAMLSNNCEWHALTMPNFEGIKIVLHNPFHSAARQQSDVMHELAHIIRQHEHVTTNHDAPLPVGMRNYNPLQEEEANCLGATLQLSKLCLDWAHKKKMTNEDIAVHFNASIEMVKYRMNVSGILKQEYYRTKTR